MKFHFRPNYYYYKLQFLPWHPNYDVYEAIELIVHNGQSLLFILITEKIIVYVCIVYREKGDKK